MPATESVRPSEETQGARSTLAAALAAWSSAIGDLFVDGSPEARQRYGRSTSPWSQAPLAVLKPATTAEVQDVVRIARRHGVPLYPISGGKNWGLGDACPTGPGQAIVDLGRLNAIREVDGDLGYAVIEAGVTQRQLYEHLRANAPHLSFDATGAGPAATIVGNVMERGFGHSPYGDRYHHSCNYEVVLSDGRLLRTGFGPYANARAAHVLKAGLGPSLDGLFTQANLGIVTAMTLWLMPKPACLEAFAFIVDDDAALPAIVDALRPLRLSGILPSTVHIANDLRVISSRTSYPWALTGGVTPLPDATRRALRKSYGIGAWNVLGGLYGTREMVRGARRSLRQALRGIATPRFINDRRLNWANRLAALAPWIRSAGPTRQRLASINAAFALLRGEPVSEPLQGVAWRSRRSEELLAEDAPIDPLDRGDGLVWLSPTLPMLGRDADHVEKLAAGVFREYGFDPLLTFVSISGRGMCCPMTICYDRSDQAEREKAADCYQHLAATMAENGYYPYRLGVQSMSLVGRGSSAHADALGLLKEGLDPQEIFAPGRYDAPRHP